MSDGPSRVLEALRQAGGQPLSGAKLSEDLGVTRSQVWKHVQGLRDRGYEVEGEPGGGYRLMGLPDRLYPEEILTGLESRWLAREIHYFDTTDSTNRVAQELARQGALHGTTVIAEGQTAGRGRLGRAFFSPPYLNLYTSIVLRPDLDTAQAPTLILAAGVAVAEAVARTLGGSEGVEIKWPNDVLLGGRKTSGVLMELGAEATRVAYLVLGIGVNLNVDARDFPADFRASATSLASHGGTPVDRVAFARRLFVTLEDVLDIHAAEGFAGLRPRFDALFRMTGREVRVSEQGGTECVGVVDDVDTQGALVLHRDDGEKVRVVAGDVTLRAPGGSR